MSRLLFSLFLALLCTLSFAARCYNLPETFIAGRIYFVDDDCYSRMTRVRQIEQQPGAIIRHQEFENFPEGVRSHATALFDYLILALKKFLDVGFANRSWGQGSLLAPQTRDLAGALVSPLLGVLTTLFLGVWGKRMARLLAPGSSLLRATMATAPALVFALSSVLVHGTALGRPDHQSLLLLLLSIALGGELLLLQRLDRENAPRSRRRWLLLTGCAWGLALWPSLFEPTIFLLVTFLALTLLLRRKLFVQERWWEVAPLLTLLALSFLAEGSRISALALAPEVIRYFPAWSRTIGELAPVPPLSAYFCEWVGYLCLLSPLLLLHAVWRDRRALLLLVFVALAYALTCWQVRWSYFFAAAFCLSLPWQLAQLRRWWIAGPLFIISLFGIATFWDGVFFPEHENERLSRQQERFYLRDAAAHLQGASPQPFIAPWWESPALAYWSGQPGVAGSSHESLPGIVDVSRFYLSPAESAVAPEILRRRRVSYVVVDEPERLLEPALSLLGGEAAPNCLARRLNDDPNDAVPYLELIYSNSFFKVLAVDLSKVK